MRFLEDNHTLRTLYRAGFSSMSRRARVVEILVSVVSDPEKNALKMRQTMMPITSKRVDVPSSISHPTKTAGFAQERLFHFTALVILCKQYLL